MMSSSSSGKPGIAGMMTAGGGALILALLFFAVLRQDLPGRRAVFDTLDIHLSPFPYGDIVIVLAWLECDRLGYDVLRSSPCNPTSGVMVYSPALLWLNRLGYDWTVADSRWLGPLIVVVFLAVATMNLGRATIPEGLFYLALLCSPPVILGLERANLDLPLFCFIFCSIALLARKSDFPGYVGCYGAGLVKFYPIAAIVGVLKPTRESRRWFLITLLAELAFLVLYWEDLSLIARSVPQSVYYSFGHPVAFLVLSNSFRARALPGQFLWKPLTVPVLVAFAVSVLVWTWRWRNRIGELLPSGPDSRAARAASGWGLYALCFTMGASFDYRYVVLLFTVPFVLTLSREHPALRTQAWLYLMALAVTFWLSGIAHSSVVTLLQEVFNWALYAVSLSASILVFCRAWLPAPPWRAFGKAA